MTIRSVLCCAVMIGFTSYTWGAEKPVSKPAPKAAPKAAKKAVKKAAPKGGIVKAGYAKAPTAVTKKPLTGKTETLTCRLGTEDRHARIGVVLVGGRIDSFAYYSKWKPRTCSIYLQRHRDGYSKWVDKGSVTSVSLERGLFMIEHGKGQYRFVFRDVDRERYCGMDGTINGTLTVRKGTEQCELTGIMEEGVALGQAYAQVEQSAPSPSPSPAVVPVRAPEAAQSKRAPWWKPRQDDSPFPAPTAGPGD